MINLNSKLFATLTIGLFVALPGLALASGANAGEPTETDPYCERVRNGSSTDYPGIGWYNPSLAFLDDNGDGADVPVGPATLMVCEGEHWDGQDTIGGDYANSGTCSGQLVDLPNDRYIIAVGQCPTPADNTPFDPTSPVGVRVSAQGDVNQDGDTSDLGFNHGAAYASIRIINVGEAAVFAGGCHNLAGDQLGPSSAFGSAGTQECQGEVGHGVLGVYLQDDMVTPVDNTVARVVTLLRLTKGYVAEGDCTQAEYAASALADFNGEPATCGRDNTAISIELLA